MFNCKPSITLAWKVLLIVLGAISLMAAVVKIPGFWTGHMLDIAGRGWN